MKPKNPKSAHTSNIKNTHQANHQINHQIDNATNSARTAESIDSIRIAVLGLGYVGLPLCLEFGKKYRTIGFDTNPQRIAELQEHIDKTTQCQPNDFLDSVYVVFSSDTKALKYANFYIIAVPTPIHNDKTPDISFLLQACEIVGNVLQKDDIVIFESTTYPTCTMNDCVPVLECVSSLKLNCDFFVGYSPERINPSDTLHTLTTIKKITSGSTPLIAQKIDSLYASIISAGTLCVSSIEVAEATKVIENAQRDINIAFVNEMFILLDKLGIDIFEVLQAAQTKWNFMPFYPGLVGGHCISVDPYYLSHIAQKIGYETKIISAGRMINNTMSSVFAQQLLKKMAQAKIEILDSDVLVVGVAFKKDCPDIRNSKVPEVVRELASFGCNVSVCDPLVDKNEVKKAYNIELLDLQDLQRYDGILIVLCHSILESYDFLALLKKNGVIFAINP